MISNRKEIVEKKSLSCKAWKRRIKKIIWIIMCIPEKWELNMSIWKFWCEETVILNECVYALARLCLCKSVFVSKQKGRKLICYKWSRNNFAWFAFALFSSSRNNNCSCSSRKYHENLQLTSPSIKISA